MTNVVALPQRTEDLIDILAAVKAQVEMGEIHAIAIVGIEPSDATRFWTATAGNVSNLRMAGAIAALEHAFHERRAG